MNSAKKIGKIVREIRKSGEHKTQEAFAELIDTSTETVSNIERGLVFLQTRTLASIAEKCNVSADYILGNSTETFPSLEKEIISKWEEKLEKDGITKADFISTMIQNYIEE